MARRAFFRFVSRTPQETEARKRFSLGRRGWAILIGSVVLLVVGAGATYVIIGMQPVRPGIRQGSEEEKLLELINAEREKKKYQAGESKRWLQIPRLDADDNLQKVAEAHARELSRKQVKPLTEDAMNKEIQDAGYDVQFWTAVPATVPSSLEEAFKTWMDEKVKPEEGLPHPRKALLNPFMEDIGIGVYRDPVTKANFVFILLAKNKKKK